jgi:protein involved in polysaccharide export with SLBB domain
MKPVLICTVVVLAVFAVQTGSMAAVAQEQTKVTSTSRGAAEATKSGIADGASSPDEMGNRRPPYRIRKSDVIEIKFNFAYEFDQTLSVQPDGFIALRDTDELYAEGLTVAELRGAVRQAYLTTLHDPEVTITLKDFGERTEARILNVKQMLKTRNLAEDFHLRAGDLLYVPQNTISKIRRYLPTSSLSTYVNPTQF